MLAGPDSGERVVHPYAPTAHESAVSDFREARRAATIEQILARLRGKSADLLCYTEVPSRLRPARSQADVVMTISLDAIVGSVGRCGDYTRSFLPALDHDQKRWTSIYEGIAKPRVTAAIEVLQIGQVYFVIDGHHRVSVARQRGQILIDARVIQVRSRVPLTPNLQPDEFRHRAEYAAFLEHTHLDEAHPRADLAVTVKEQYDVLEAQIEYYAGLLTAEGGIHLSLEEVASRWYEDVYLSRLRRLRKLDILKEFPGRTETDLYVWVCRHRAYLEDALGWEVELELAAADLVRQASARPRRRLARVGQRLRDFVTPNGLLTGPGTGTWRRRQGRTEQQDAPAGDCLFRSILVPCDGSSRDWPAVAQAAELSCSEGAQLLGLHVASTAEEAGTEPVRVMQGEFERHCQRVGVQGRLQVAVGQVAGQICEHSRWADLVVVGLDYPPAASLSARLTSSLCTVIRRCPTPVLAVPGTLSPMARPLLAYDGSPKAREALYMGAYLATRGQGPLTIISVAQNGMDAPAALYEAQAYLEGYGVVASYLEGKGPVAPAILRAAREMDNDLILMGGYGHSPLREVILGSVVDEILRGSENPVLVCR